MNKQQQAQFEDVSAVLATLIMIDTNDPSCERVIQKAIRGVQIIIASLKAEQAP